MKLGKVTHAAGQTYIVVRANDVEDPLTITIDGMVNVSMNNDGSALSITFYEGMEAKQR